MPVCSSGRLTRGKRIGIGKAASDGWRAWNESNRSAEGEASIIHFLTPRCRNHHEVIDSEEATAVGMNGWPLSRSLIRPQADEQAFGTDAPAGHCSKANR